MYHSILTPPSAPLESLNPFHRQKSRTALYDPVVEKFYRECWPGYIGCDRTDDDLEAQLRGVDRFVQDASGLWRVDDKVDFKAAETERIYLEVWDNHPHREGWLRTSTSHFLLSIVPYTHHVAFYPFPLDELRERADELKSKHPIGFAPDKESPWKTKGFQCIPIVELRDIVAFGPVIVILR